MNDGRIEANRPANPAASVVFHTRAYTMLMEASQAAMPGETAGLLFGDVQRTGADNRVWIAVKAITAIDFADRGNKVRLNSLQTALERMSKIDPALKVVGWFYADPGTGVFAPRVPIPATQTRLPDGANLFLLVNPATDQGAFYVWNGHKYSPAGGFYEAVPDPGAPPIIGWSGEVRGVTAWLGPMLAELEASSAAKQLGENGAHTWISPGSSPEEERENSTGGHLEGSDLAELDTQYDMALVTGKPEIAQEETETLVTARVANGGPLLTADQPDSDFSSPFYVEVITEEPVEYTTSGMTPHTEELPPFSKPEIAGIVGYVDASIATEGDDTMPYPMLLDTPEVAITMPHKVVLLPDNAATMPHAVIKLPETAEDDGPLELAQDGETDRTMPQPILAGAEDFSEYELSGGKSYNTVPLGTIPLGHRPATADAQVTEWEDEEPEEEAEPGAPPSPTFSSKPLFLRRVAITAPLGATPDLHPRVRPVNSGQQTGPLEQEEVDEPQHSEAMLLGQVTGPLPPLPEEFAPYDPSEPLADEHLKPNAPVINSETEVAQQVFHYVEPFEVPPDTQADESALFSPLKATDPAVITGTLVPPPRSIVRPVVRQKSGLEALLAVGGAVAAGIVGIFMLADLVAKQNSNRPGGSQAQPQSTVTVIINSSEAAARNPIVLEPTITPSITITVTPSTEPAATP